MMRIRGYRLLVSIYLLLMRYVRAENRGHGSNLYSLRSGRVWNESYFQPHRAIDCSAVLHHSIYLLGQGL
jgi:hypothetical protein